MLAKEEFLNNVFMVTQGFESVHSTTLKIDTKNNPPKILSKMWRWWNDERKQKIEMSERTQLRKDVWRKENSTSWTEIFTMELSSVTVMILMVSWYFMSLFFRILFLVTTSQV